jgi:hypothetical protein
MRWLLTSLAIALCSASIGSIASTTEDEQQLPLMVATDGAKMSGPLIRVPGTNNATYGPVPEAQQLMQIEFLEIAPSPFEM